ncbi:hypothetical protein BsWGS_16949 [Bradybaena similaris]
MRRPKYRLSPNEVERLVKEDQEQRRKLRIIQVREQSKANASIIRNDVRREKERLLNQFAAVLKEQLEAEKEENIRKFEQKYENTLRTIGEGHKEALIHGDGVNRAEKLQRQMQDEAAAQQRFTQALDQKRKEDSLKEFEKTKNILARQAALLTEKQRAMEIASLPPPPPDITVELEKTKKRAVPMVDMQAFATTHYHIPDYQVVRAGSQEQLYNAKSQAQDATLKLRQDLEDKARSEHARLERARIRGNEALQKELLKHDYEDMLKDLSLLQKKDRWLRKKMLSQIPKQVFIPPEIYLEEKMEKQNEMERKFNEIYMDHSKMERDKQRLADASHQIVSHEFESVASPLPPVAAPTAAAAAEDFSISMSRINPALRDLTNHSPPVRDSEARKPDTVLKQLLNRIKEQRDDSGTNDKVPLASEAVPSASEAVPSASEAVSTIPAEAKRKPTSGEDNRIVTAAGKAEWVTPLDDSPGLEPGVTAHTRRSLRQANGEANPQPGIEVRSMTENDKMIEDLWKRIQLIQSQKEELAQQLQAQGVACLVSDTDGSTLEGIEEDWTLEEVDIDGSTQMDEQVNVLPMERVASNVEQTTAASAWAPPWGSGWGTAVGSHLRTDVDSAFTVEARRDTGMQPQVSNLQMDKTNLNIGPANSALKPMDSWDIPGDLRTTVGPGFISGARKDLGVPPQGSSVSFDKADSNIGLAKSAWKPPGSWNIPGDLRTNVGSGFISGARRDFEWQQERRLLQECGMGEVVRFGGFGLAGSASGVLKLAGDAQQILQNPSFDRMTASSLGYGTMGSHTDESASQGVVRFGPGENESIGWSVGLGNDNGDMVRKVQEYRERAVERQANMDAETLSKVRAYQHQLLQTYEDKKKYLADIRADIEKRQQELATAASSKPAFSIPVKQSVADKWGNLTGNSQTVSAGQKMVPSGTGESNVGEIFNDRKNVQMHESSKASLPTGLSASHVGHRPNGGSGAENVCHKVSSTCVAAGQQKIIKSASLRDNRCSGEKYNIDTVRKSLSFDEECMMSGHGPWKGVVDADTSNCSHASTDDSRLISSEEERGSPVLPQGHLGVSEKSHTLLQDRPYVYGSALLAQAQERKLGFEHRQMELQNQLLDIQRQKDAIMQAYYTGQSALQHREETLMSKMATASALLNVDSNEKQRVEVRAKLAHIRSQIDTDARSRTMSQGNVSGNTSIDVAQGKESRSDLAATNANYNVPPQPTDSLNESADIDRTSSWQSLGNISMPGNTSSDSYLAEISFHKIRSDDGRSLPSSAFHVPLPSSATSISVPRTLTQSHQQQPQTWASILSTSAPSQQQSVGQQQDSLQNDRLGSQNEVNTGILSNTGHLEQQKATSNQKESFQNARSLAAQVVESGSYDLVKHQYTSSPVLCGLTPHQPHELSTILEVDTPGSVSAVTSGRKLVISSGQSTGTSDHINSIPSQAWNLPRTGASVLVDVFADLPYTFQETRAASLGSGAVFHLKPGHKFDEASSDRSEPGLRLDSSVSCGQKQTKAKRSLDFSDNSHVSTLPALVEFAQYRASDIQVPGMKRIEQVNLDTDRTPGQDASVGEDSSLKISGFSEYLRVEESGGANAVDEWTGMSALSSSTSHVDAAGNVGSFAASEDKASDRPEVLGSVPHGHSFDAKTVERLQQQSRAVFGDVVAGEGSHETSVASLLCSSLSCDLEEASIPEAGH